MAAAAMTASGLRLVHPLRLIDGGVGNDFLSVGGLSGTSSCWVLTVMTRSPLLVLPLSGWLMAAVVLTASQSRNLQRKLLYSAVMALTALVQPLFLRVIWNPAPVTTPFLLVLVVY